MNTARQSWTINTELGPGIHLPRTSVVDELINAVESSRVVVVQGVAGSGKSAAVKILLETETRGSFVWIQGSRVQSPAYPPIPTSIGISLTLEQLKSELSLLPRKLLLIDGAERLFELSHLEVFRQFLQQLRDDSSWTIVITCRESSTQELTSTSSGNGVLQRVLSKFPFVPASWLGLRDRCLI